MASGGMLPDLDLIWGENVHNMAFTTTFVNLFLVFSWFCTWKHLHATEL